MSKFQRIDSNRFGTSQFRSIKQLVEYQKQETEREKTPKEQPLCVEQYVNPFVQSNHCNNRIVEECHPEIVNEVKCENYNDDTAEIQSNEDLTLSQPTEALFVKEQVIEHDQIYPDKEEIKPVEMQQEIANIRNEFVRKQSLKDVVKLSYRTFLKKEPSFM